MPKFEVRNRRTCMVLGEVVCADAAEALDALKDATGSSVEEIALSLGATVQEAIAALEILEIGDPNAPRSQNRSRHPTLPRHRLYG